LLRCWEQGQRVHKLIGFDATEDHRTFADGKGMNVAPRPGVPPYGDRYVMRYPLREWGFDRAACGRIITGAGLPLPPKSACFFCPAMKQIEIELLRTSDPVLYMLALEMERLYRSGPHFRGDDIWTVKAVHKVTKEKAELEVNATSADEARRIFRKRFKDTAQPYSWNLSPSPAVPGLGRSFAWSERPSIVPITIQSSLF
jgi:hypothetical protein